MAETNNDLQLSDLGEFGLIEHLTKYSKIKHESSVLGIGDDAAVVDYSENQTVVTSDILVEGIHFDLVYTPLKHLGYKSVVVNVSDICAMNAIPRQIVVSIAFSSKFTLKAIDEIYSGIHLACEKYNIDLIGGDTSTSLTGLTISITALGEIEQAKAIGRNSAENTDLICVTGDLGAAYLGLKLLQREKEVFKANPHGKPEFEGFEYILERQLKPEAKNALRDLLIELNVSPTSMIDISDGLSSEIMHICKQSDVGCKIFEEKIPIHPETKSAALTFNSDPTIAALSGGEDYEILFTVSISDFDKIKDQISFSIIGHITNKEEGMKLVSRSGTEIDISAQGWNAFKEGKNE